MKPQIVKSSTVVFLKGLSHETGFFSSEIFSVNHAVEPLEKEYKDRSDIWARVGSTPYIGDKLIPPLIGNPYNWYINP